MRMQVLAFDTVGDYEHSMQPGVVPASVIAISMGIDSEVSLTAGSIPASVKWLRLPKTYRHVDWTGVLAQSTRVLWHDNGEDDDFYLEVRRMSDAATGHTNQEAGWVLTGVSCVEFS
jgi:hypothetical protein